DLEQAFLGSLRAVAAAPPERSARRVLLRQVEAATASPRAAEGLLSWWTRQRSELQRARARILTLADDPEGRAEAASIAARFLAIGAPRAFLQAALGLAGADGVTLRDPRLASRCAHALDPTFFPTPPAVFASLEHPTQTLGDLEDEFEVQVSARLARRCSGEKPLAVGLRARFPSHCARSLVQELAAGPLPADLALALRELADPFVIDAIARVLLPAGRWRELLTYWRSDLPLPAGLRDTVRALGSDGKQRVLLALRSHLHPSCHQLLADLMVEDEPELRQLAAEALRAAVGERVPFDAKWPRSRRLDAASRLRDLHNRRP
ncbi:MAG: hypothetical protein KAI24_17980, partial [Planctomycetes bacterium]|nr:hypothetical protein [Planctomycetota bacterium]